MNNLLKTIKNWHIPVLHYFGLRKHEDIVEFKSGLKCIIRNKSDAIAFFENFFLNTNLSEEIKIKENDIILDIGAHVGYFTIFVSRQAKYGKIFSFEPSSSSYDVLKENLRINNLTNVTVENIGISNKSGKMTLYVDEKNGISNNLYFKGKYSDEEEISVTTLSKIIKKFNFSKIDLLKLDCEGAEFEILKSLEKNEIAMIKKISMEAHPSIGKFDLDDLMNYLLQNNFKSTLKYFSKNSFPMVYAINQV